MNIIYYFESNRLILKMIVHTWKYLIVLLFGFFSLISTVVTAENSRPQVGAAGTKSDSMAEIGSKLVNPLSNVWSLQFENDFNWYDGDIVDGHKYGSSTIFQPVMPFNFSDNWKLITRPVIPNMEDTHSRRF